MSKHEKCRGCTGSPCFHCRVCIIEAGEDVGSDEAKLRINVQRYMALLAGSE